MCLPTGCGAGEGNFFAMRLLVAQCFASFTAVKPLTTLRTPRWQQDHRGFHQDQGCPAGRLLCRFENDAVYPPPAPSASFQAPSWQAEVPGNDLADHAKGFMENDRRLVCSSISARVPSWAPNTAQAK